MNKTPDGISSFDYFHMVEDLTRNSNLDGDIRYITEKGAFTLIRRLLPGR